MTTTTPTLATRTSARLQQPTTATVLSTKHSRQPARDSIVRRFLTALVRSLSTAAA
jgi:hypothetical protein